VDLSPPDDGPGDDNDVGDWDSAGVFAITVYETQNDFWVEDNPDAVYDPSEIPEKLAFCQTEQEISTEARKCNLGWFVDNTAPCGVIRGRREGSIVKQPGSFKGM
jgi:hypothetical protein